MENESAHLILAEELLNGGDLEGARAILEGVLIRSPSLEEAHELLARVQAADGSRDDSALSPTPVYVEERRSDVAVEAEAAEEPEAAVCEAEDRPGLAKSEDEEKAAATVEEVEATAKESAALESNPPAESALLTESAPPAKTALASQVVAAGIGDQAAATLALANLTAHAEEIDRALARAADHLDTDRVEEAMGEVEPVLRKMGDSELANEILAKIEEHRPPEQDTHRQESGLSAIIGPPTPRPDHRPSRWALWAAVAVVTLGVLVSIMLFVPDGGEPSVPDGAEERASQADGRASATTVPVESDVNGGPAPDEGQRETDGAVVGAARGAGGGFVPPELERRQGRTPDDSADEVTEKETPLPTGAEPQMSTVPAPAPLGSLVIDASPWARIESVRRVDGSVAQLGDCRNTPCRLRLSAGSYTIELRHPSFPPLTVTARVVAGQTVTAIGRLAERSAEDVLVEIDQ